MSRPHGAAGKPAFERNIKAAPSFQEARKALVGILENLSFVKVVTVQPGKPAGGLSAPGAAPASLGAYNGEAVELSFREAKERPKLVFFDKFGRTRNLLKVGPITLAQAPLGPDHPSAVPTVGEVLVGSLVPNARKSHLDHVLRGWSSDAKPLWELLRILRFGTKASEFEVRSILTQACSNLMQSPPHIKAVRDDIYMCARVILWGSVRPLQVLAVIQNSGASLSVEPTDAEREAAKSLRISCSAIDFMDALTMKLNDATLSEALQNGLTLPVPEPDSSLGVSVGAHGALGPPPSYGQPYGQPYGQSYGPPPAYGPTAAGYVAPTAAGYMPPTTDYQGWLRAAAPAPAPVWAAGGGGGPTIGPPSAPSWSWTQPTAAAPVGPAAAGASEYDPSQNFASAFRRLPAPGTPPRGAAGHGEERVGSPVAGLPYNPTSPVAYAPTSPVYAPTSPVYVPTSPVENSGGS